MKLSLVVPCYNEEQNIAPLFEKIQGEFQNKIDSYELVFVNDGSKDRTIELIKQYREIGKQMYKDVCSGKISNEEFAKYSR